MILGITSATVGKHLERIYPKLGVENRTAAPRFSGFNVNRFPSEHFVAVLQPFIFRRPIKASPASALSWRKRMRPSTPL
jgi:hypothetical protein